jgi:hypothetical protein
VCSRWRYLRGWLALEMDVVNFQFSIFKLEGLWLIIMYFKAWLACFGNDVVRFKFSSWKGYD